MRRPRSFKDFSYPDDSLGKVLHFTDKDAHTVNQVVSHIVCEDFYSPIYN